VPNLEEFSTLLNEQFVKQYDQCEYEHEDRYPVDAMHILHP
jgi:hypothetical protein